MRVALGGRAMPERGSIVVASADHVIGQQSFGTSISVGPGRPVWAMWNA
jgi:hypothetical protein